MPGRQTTAGAQTPPRPTPATAVRAKGQHAAAHTAQREPHQQRAHAHRQKEEGHAALRRLNAEGRNGPNHTIPPVHDTLRPAVGHALHAARPIERFQLGTPHITGVVTFAEGRVNVAVQLQSHRVARRQEAHGHRVACLRIDGGPAFGHHKWLAGRLARHQQEKKEQDGKITFHGSTILHKAKLRKTRNLSKRMSDFLPHFTSARSRQALRPSVPSPTSRRAWRNHACGATARHGL